MKAVSSTFTGLSEAKPHHQRGHRDAMIHVGGDEAAAGNMALAFDDQIIAEISTLTPLTRSMSAVASRRSDSLTRNSCRPRITVVPSARRLGPKAPDIRRSSTARFPPAPRPRAASIHERAMRHRFAGGASPPLSSIDAPISRSVGTGRCETDLS